MADNALGILGTVADLAGLATKIGTAVPGLKKARKRDTSQRAVRQGAIRTGQAAVGGAQTGHGATRGLALRSGLRAASNAARTALDPASTAAAQDEARFIAERDARNQRVAQFGADAAGFAGQVGQGIVDLKAADAALETGDGVTLPSQEEVLGIDPVTGLSIADQVEPANAALGLPPMPDMQLEEPGQDFGQQEQSQSFGVAPSMTPPTTAMQAYQSAMGIQPNPALQLAPVMEYKLRVTNLAVQEAERLGVDPSVIIAPLLRNLNIDPMQLQAPGYDGEHADMEAQVEEGGY